MKPLHFIRFMFLFMLLILKSISSGEQNIGHETFNKNETIQNKGRDSQNKLAKRSTPNRVDIDMFKERSVPYRYYTVHVDSTITRLIIEISTDNQPALATLEKPSGVQLPDAKLSNGTTQGGKIVTFDVSILPSDYGVWTLRRLDASFWSVKIQGDSSLDLACLFFQRNIPQKPIKGDPIQGETYRTVLNLLGYIKVRVVKDVKIYLANSLSPSNTIYPVLVGGGSYEISKLKMFEEDFKIAIRGEDIFGRTFQRIAIIKPIALILSVPAFNGLSMKTLEENARMELSFTVINKLAQEERVYIRITDTKGLAQQPDVLSTTLKPGENYTGKFILDGGKSGDRTTVTITTVRSDIGNRQNNTGPSVMHTFVVKSTKTTTISTSPSTTKERTTSMANSQSMFTSPSLSLTSLVGISNKNIFGTSTSSNSILRTTVDTKSSVTSQSGSSINASANGQGMKTAPEQNKQIKSFSREEMFGAASISGLSSGVLIGVGAFVTMGLLLRKYIDMKKVTPNTEEN